MPWPPRKDVAPIVVDPIDLAPLAGRYVLVQPRDTATYDVTFDGLGAMIDYRKADLSDVAIVAHLRQAGEAGGDSADRMSRYLAGVHHPQEALLPRVMWIAAQDEAPIGYVAGHLTRRFGCDGELQWIYVVPEHRRTGIASTLLRLLAGWFLQQEARRICVDVGDDDARPFYQRHGAVELNRHWMVWEDISSVRSS